MQIVGSLLILAVIGISMTDLKNNIKDLSMILGLIGVAILIKRRKK